MKNFFLKPTWPVFDRRLFQLLLVLLALVFTSFIFAVLADGSWVFPMKTSLIPDLQSIPLFEFITPFGDFSPEINSLINFQKYETNGFVLPLWAGRIFQFLFILSISLITTVIIRISKWWFYFGLSLVVLFLVSFKLQEFGIISNYDDYFLYASILFAVGSVFYLHNYHFEKSLRFHFLSSLLIWCILWLVILMFGNGNEILFQIGNFSFMASLFIVAVFIIMIGHEPILIFFTMISYSYNQYSKRRMLNFIILTVLYLGSVALVYLKTIGKIDWDIIYSPFQLFLLFAMICGFYGFPKRFESGKLFNSQSLSLLIYTGLSLFTLGFLSFAYFADHDAIIEIMEDITLYSQLGMGTIFFFYLIINFGDLLINNVKAYRVVFQPSRFPLATAFVGGTVVILAMFMRSNMFPYYQSMGVVYNGMADNYRVNGDMQMAEVFYEEGSIFAYNNRRSNACLSDIYKSHGQLPASTLSIKRAVTKNPLPVHYLSLADNFEINDKYFDALFALQEGIDRFPESKAIANNLGLLYTKINVYDSAFIYFNLSDEISRERNLSALLSKSSYFNPDSLPELSQNDLSEITNRVSIYSKTKNAFPESFEINLLDDSIIDFDAYSYFYNVNLNKILTSREIDRIQVEGLLAKNPGDSYKRDLYLLSGLDHYFKNEIAAAVSDFDNAVNFSGLTTPVIADLCASLLWKKELYPQAIEKIDRAARVAYKNSAYKLLILYIEVGDRESAISQIGKANVREFIAEADLEDWDLISNPDFNIEDLNGKSETIKYAAFRLYPEKWDIKNLMTVPELFTMPELQENVSKYALQNLIQIDRSVAKAFYEKWSKRLNNSSALDRVYLKYLYINEDFQIYKDLYQKMNRNSEYQVLFDAWYFKIIGNDSLYNIASQKAINSISFDPDVALMKIEELQNSNQDDMYVYESLVAQMQIFPEHIGLKKLYVLITAKMGLESYAENELELLKILLNKTQFDDFYAAYQKELSLHSDGEDW